MHTMVAKMVYSYELALPSKDLLHLAPLILYSRLRHCPSMRGETAEELRIMFINVATTRGSRRGKGPSQSSLYPL